MTANAPTFAEYRPDQLAIAWEFLYEDGVTNVMAGTHRRLGKSFILAEFLFLLSLDALGVIDLGSDKIAALKARNAKVAREFTLTVALPSYEQFKMVYRQGALPLAAARYRVLYPHVTFDVPLSGHLLKVSHGGREIFTWPVGMEPQSIELRRGIGTDILMIDEIASADYTRIQQVLLPTLEDTQGFTLIVGSAQAQSRRPGRAVEIAGFSKVRQHYQTAPRHRYIKIGIDDSTQDDGTRLLSRQRILEEHGWADDNPIFLQEYCVDDTIVPAQGLFRLWSTWQNEPHRLVVPNYAVSVDIGFRDAYVVCLYAYSGEHVNLIWAKEYDQTLTPALLSDLYPVVAAHTRRLDYLFLPFDSTAHHAKTPKTEADIWTEWELSPPLHNVFTNLKNTDSNIRRALNVINKVRLDLPADPAMRALVEERIKNATFSLGGRELIYHDRHSHFASALCYGLLGMVQAGILLDPVVEPEPPPVDHRTAALQAAFGE